MKFRNESTHTLDGRCKKPWHFTHYIRNMKYIKDYFRENTLTGVFEHFERSITSQCNLKYFPPCDVSI